jgi:DNA-binding IscR family transcriptional regulator
LCAAIRVPRHLLEPVCNSLMGAALLTRTSEHRLIPARDLRRIAVADILACVRSSEQDLHHLADDEWNPRVAEIASDIERAIRDALGGRTLADIVEADLHADQQPR